MKAAIIILCILNAIKIEALFLQVNFKKSINEVLFAKSSVTEKCANQLKLVEKNLKDKNALWASESELTYFNEIIYFFSVSFDLTVISSWSTIHSTITYGNSYDFGNFDQCMNIRHKSNSHEQVNGQYCMFQFYSKSNQTISQGPKESDFNYEWKKLNERFGAAICLPSTCSPDVVRKLVQRLLSESNYEVALDYDQNNFCKSSKLGTEFSASFILFGCVTIILLVCATSSTIYDFLIKNLRGEKRNKWFLTFSIYTNGSNLFNKEQPLDTIKSLSGIRVLSALTIVYFHSYSHRLMFPVESPQQVTAFKNSEYGIIVTVLTIAVDFFFVLSGLLVTRSILKDLDSGTFNLWRLYFRRYMRLTPSLAFVLLASINFGEYFVQNAPYAFYNDLVKPCKDNWWTTLLHIQVPVNSNNIVRKNILCGQLCV
jgi:Nose resistant-to-fluoxetine protein, N-terminal domain/Acyltransferase family